MSPSYRYLPWVREGAAHAFANEDALGPVLSKAGGKLSVLPVGLLVNDRTRVDVPLRVLGPGDVVGLDPRTVLRTDPLSRTADFEPNYLACIEFDTPDFPWLFTPAAAGLNGRLRPWLVLVVVRQVEAALSSNRELPLPQLETPVGELPDLRESWAWAHAQVVRMDAVQPVADLLTAHHDRNLSRLVAPRRLQPETSYLACVVPAFEAGRKAGLGEEVKSEDEDKLAPAWDGTRPRVRLPVYYYWEFATGRGGDFESLARRLEPRPVAADVGRRPLRVGVQPFGLPDGGVLELEGALVAPGEHARPAPTAAFRTALRKLVNLADGKPVVAPPVYGRWQTGRDAVPAESAPPAWLRELNVDPSARAVAGLGVVVVQESQEQLAAAAWNQLGDPTAVAGLERRLEVAVAVLDSVVRRRLEPMAPARLVQFLGPAQKRLLASPETLHTTLARQGLPPSFSAPAFRRVLKPVAPSKVGFPRGPLPFQAIATRLGSALQVIGPAPTATGLVTQAVMVEAVNQVPRAKLFPFMRFRAAAAELRDYAASFSQRPISKSIQFGFTAELKTSLLTSLEPQQNAAPRFYARISADAGLVQPPPAPGESVLFAPSFPQPMYEALRDLSPELLMPGVGTIVQDTVTLLNSNPRFIEAYMIGLNHELAGELLWREFPNDTRATYFRSFWDTRGVPVPVEQLAPIASWSPDAGLGGNFGAGAHVVLLIRGELLQRYPDALVYAGRAAALDRLGTEEKLPLFRGRIEPDITFLGFDLTEAQARGPKLDPGWFFVIQEQPTAPRFGFDETRETPLDTWNDVAWSDVGTQPGAHVVALDPAAPSVANPGGIAWAFNAAHMAAILRQRPVRIAIHARQLLPPPPEKPPT
jgi:hypothetical protein